ncbi:MAG: type IV pilus biogenesis protein PilM [Acetobacteraceae bacterium]|nr:type IV pilus biogenesis protein PilM [Acetobacteraceae bacterium]
MYVLLPVVVLAALMGLYSMARVPAAHVVQPRAELMMQAQAALFVSYRNAVVAYVTANPAFVGAVPVSALVRPATVAALPGQGNQVVATPSGQGRVIYVWAALPAGTASQAARATSGDLSYGVVSGNAWVSPVAGAMGALGVAVPAGDVVSICQIGV